MSETGPAPLPVARVWDVDWVDIHGSARIDGFLVSQSEVRDRVGPGDRTGTGRLTAVAKERIAEELTACLRRVAVAAGREQGGDAAVPLVLRDCEG